MNTLPTDSCVIIRDLTLMRFIAPNHTHHVLFISQNIQMTCPYSKLTKHVFFSQGTPFSVFMNGHEYRKYSDVITKHCDVTNNDRH